MVPQVPAPLELAPALSAELVTNSVIHAAERSPHVDISVYIRAGHLVIAVHDRHPHCPSALPASRPNGGGWGLKMIADLTAQYGGEVQIPEDQDGGGKVGTAHQVDRTVRAAMNEAVRSRTRPGRTKRPGRSKPVEALSSRSEGISPPCRR
ncbi:ATP-binding protein [Streptomyces sp. NPDC005408]|uniref:ATP-binding protein n=1 Tax=Streptomyces sp. NPDC005408 TaxID=3155341 RepID=UPI0033B8C8F0